jgi:hypothetical protein
MWKRRRRKVIEQGAIETVSLEILVKVVVGIGKRKTVEGEHVRTLSTFWSYLHSINIL